MSLRARNTEQATTCHIQYITYHTTCPLQASYSTVIYRYSNGIVGRTISISDSGDVEEAIEPSHVLLGSRTDSDIVISLRVGGVVIHGYDP